MKNYLLRNLIYQHFPKLQGSCPHIFPLEVMNGQQEQCCSHTQFVLIVAFARARTLAADISVLPVPFGLRVCKKKSNTLFFYSWDTVMGVLVVQKTMLLLRAIYGMLQKYKWSKII